MRGRYQSRRGETCSATSKNRYLEPVPDEHVVRRDLLGVWSGEEDLDRSVQRETLALFEDGTFTHDLAHIVAGPVLRSSSSCKGQWRLYNIRYFGADVDAAADREIEFEGVCGVSHVKRLVVCGTNPWVNGFFGSACRLYPVVQGQSSSEVQPGDKVNSIVLEPSREHMERLAEAVGQPLERCLAAVRQCGGSLEEAATQLLESTCGEDVPPREAGGSSTAPHEADDFEESGRRLAEVTGKTLESCFASLLAHGCRADLAAASLMGLEDLTLPTSAPTTRSSSPTATRHFRPSELVCPLASDVLEDEHLPGSCNKRARFGVGGD